jgi:hypothetical protein
MESGTVLADRFRLKDPLGEGSGGVVWRARDERLGRDVAVKVLNRENPGSITLERFRREGILPAAVQHPGITVVYDIGVHEERQDDVRRAKRLFIVTELLAGRDLGKVLSDNPEGLATERVIDFGIQLADALAAAHEGKIVHRDLKPSNLFVLPDERLKICDFGIAGDMSPEAIAGRWTAGAIGTPLYMSPEQWDGRPSSPGMDLYAMGCIMYEMLTGKVPFEGSFLFELMKKHVREEPVPPRDHKQGVPATLNDLTLRLLAKSPADRPDSAWAVASKLRGIRDAEEAAAIKARQEEAVATAVADTEAAAAGRIAAAKARAEKAEARAHDLEAALRAARGPSSDPAARVTAPLACASLGPGHFEIFVHDGAARLQHRARDAGGWERRPGIGLPEGQVTAIAAGSYRRGVRVLIAVADGAPYLKEWQEDRGTWLSWADWRPLPGDGPLAPGPVVDACVASPVSGELNVLTLDTAGHVRHRRAGRDGRDDWEDVALPGGLTATAIAAASHQERRLTLAAATSGNGGVQVRPWHHNNGWGTWLDLGRPPLPGLARGQGGPVTGRGLAITDIACSSLGPGHLVVFVLDEDGGIWQRSWSERARSAWSDWVAAPAPGGGVTAIAAAPRGGPRQAVAALTPGARSADGGTGYTPLYAEVSWDAVGVSRWSGWSG